METVEQEVVKISRDEARTTLRGMKSGESVGPDDILSEVCM